VGAHFVSDGIISQRMAARDNLEYICVDDIMKLHIIMKNKEGGGL
jgi:hypothetical protein